MWRGNELSLIQYGTAVCVEWMGRGNPDNTLKKILAFKDFFLEEPIGDGANVVRAAMPEWMGNAALHDAHKSFLLRAKPSWYRQFWPKLNDELAMVWPRSPEKQRTTSDERQKEKLVARAIRLKERADAARTDAHDAAIKAGLDPNTMKPKLDPELAALK
jgi:hypothetical protein